MFPLTTGGAQTASNRALRTTVRRRASSGLTRSKRLWVMKLAMAMTSAREHYIREYWDSSFLLPVVDMPRRLVEARRKRGWWSNELSPHQNKVALETALGIVRASWRSAIGRTRKEIESDRSLSPEEVAY